MPVWCLEAWDTEQREARTREYTTSDKLAERWERIPRIQFTDSGHGIVFQATAVTRRGQQVGRRMDHAVKHLREMRSDSARRPARLSSAESALLEVLAAEEVRRHEHPPHALVSALAKLREATR
jgi:hypothetical protein